MDAPLAERTPSLRWLLQAVGFAISLVAVGVVVAQVDLQATLRVLGQARPLPLVLAIGALLVQLGFLAYRWRLLLAAGWAARAFPFAP